MSNIIERWQNNDSYIPSSILATKAVTSQVSRIIVSLLVQLRIWCGKGVKEPVLYPMMATLETSKPDCEASMAQSAGFCGDDSSFSLEPADHASW